MIINNIPKFTIQSKNLSRNKIQYNSYLNNDIFVKNCSFSGKSESKDEKSFAELKKWAEKTSFIDKVEDIVYRTGRILGSGFEGKTYSIIVEILLQKKMIEEVSFKLEIFLQG